MSPIYVPGKVVLRQEYIGTDDPDAAAYIAAVEAADEAASPGIGALETGVKVAIHSFVKGCKADGIWPALKASCILAGARTLDGCLVPLAGTAPTNNNFVSGDYNRETGLLGNASTKWLNSNRAGDADPVNSAHLSVFASTASTSGQFKQYISCGTGQGPFKGLAYDTSLGTYGSMNSNSASGSTGTSLTGFLGVSRASSATVNFRLGGTSSNVSNTSTSAPTGNIAVFSLQGGSNFSDGRLAFYSIGESLDLALLDARVTALIAAIGAAIP